jgi:hypothetical protein
VRPTLVDLLIECVDVLKAPLCDPEHHVAYLDEAARPPWLTRHCVSCWPRQQAQSLRFAPCIPLSKNQAGAWLCTGIDKSEERTSNKLSKKRSMTLIGLTRNGLIGFSCVCGRICSASVPISALAVHELRRRKETPREVCNAGTMVLVWARPL